MKEILISKTVWKSEDISKVSNIECHQTFIRDMGNEYRIDSPGAHALFDKTDQMLQGVIDAVEKYGCLISGKSGSPFFNIVDENGKKTALPLVQVIAGIYKCLPHSTFRGKRFRYIDKDHRNLHTSNIWCSGHAIDVFSRFGKAYIIVICSSNGKRYFAVTNYSPQLFHIINSRQWYYDAGTQEVTSTNNVKLKHIVWAHFKKGATIDNIDVILEQIKAEFNPTHSPIPQRDMLVIDHKISGQEKWDTRIENLQAISYAQNAQKNDCTSLLKDNLFYLPTDSGEVYGQYNEDTISYYRRTGNVNEAELDKLKFFCRSGELPKEHETHCYSIPQAAAILKADLTRSYLYQYGEKAKRRVRLGNFFDPVKV